MRHPAVYFSWRGPRPTRYAIESTGYLPLLDRHVRLRNVAELLKLSRPAVQRLEWIIWYERTGENAAKAARHYGIAPKTFWKWRKRFKDSNLRTLEDISRVPHNRRVRTITPQEELCIVELRKAHLRYGKEKIARIYATYYGRKISAWKVQKTIQKYKLYFHPKKNALAQARRKRSLIKKRITELSLHPRTGFLFRLDSIVRYWDGTKRFVLTAIDTTSRLAFARMYASHSSATAADFLQRLHALVEGKIENVRTDNGSEFHGAFEDALKKLEIPHYWSRVKTPKDNAANERFNRTLDEEFMQMGNAVVDTVEFNRRLTEWLIEHNFRRPHQALGYSTPINFIYSHERLLPMYPSSTSACAFPSPCLNSPSQFPSSLSASSCCPEGHCLRLEEETAHVRKTRDEKGL
jgi:transposase InsO family protein